jgi:elongation factor Ts
MSGKVDIKEVKRLRELTGVGITDAKKALEDAAGDFDKALQQMRKKGLTKAEKRGEREARAGIIGNYNHDSRIGVVIEVNCETDFVARNEIFTSLVKDIAMHIAASAPLYVSGQDVPEAERKRVTEEFKEKAKSEGKPAEMLDKITEGMVKKHFAERCLLDQPFIKNPDQNVGTYIKEHIAKLGENIVVKRFSRLALGEVE